jgi:hypothetical protein
MRTNDPKLYRELSTPFESLEQANKNLEAFQTELGEIRKKYKIPDLAICMRINFVDRDGQEGEAMSVATLGNQFAAEACFAYGLGQVQAERQELLASILSRSGAMKKGSRG